MLALNDVERFRNALGRCLGLTFVDGQIALLVETLQRRLDASGRASGEYIGQLETAPSRDEIGMLARDLTVCETYFFRHIQQFRAMAEVAVPDRLADQHRPKRLRLLSAGCASGEEPFSLSIILREHAVDLPSDVSIKAVDVNPLMLDKAARGRYSEWALRETHEDVRRKWFRQDGREVVIADAARSLVQFDQRNLVEDDAEFWQTNSYDIIFCRNVLMYFSAETARSVIARITHCLAPGGFLFLGHAETLRGLSQDFHLRHTHGTFYYQRKDLRDADCRFDAVKSQGAAHGTLPLAAVVDAADGWVDAIRRASERVENLARIQDQITARANGVQTPEVQRPWDLGKALDLLKCERFADALDVLQGLPPEAALDPEVLLLRAALLTHGGRFSVAENVCHRLMEVDELNAGAHYLLALCRE